MAAIPAVNLKNLLNTLADVSDVWEPIGIGLGVADHIIMSTKHDVSLDDIRRLSQVLRAWIDNDEDVSWDKIIEVLESPAVNKIPKAKEIRQLTGQVVPVVTTTESTAAAEGNDGPELEVVPQPPDVYCPSMGDIKPVPTPFTEDLVTDVNVILVTATEVEFCAVMGQANDANLFLQVLKNNVTFYLGVYGVCKVAVIRTGQNDKRTREILDKVQEVIKARYVIAVGICYGMKKDKVKPGDVIVAESIFDASDKRAQEDGTISRPKEYMCGKDLCSIFKESVGFDLKNGSGSVSIKFGPLVSERTLVASQKHKDQLLKQIPQALGGEMEGNGIMPDEAGKFEGIVIKAVADYGNKDKEPYRKWQEFAATAAASYVLHHFKRPDIAALLQSAAP